jgi:hypothetical protein
MITILILLNYFKLLSLNAEIIQQGFKVSQNKDIDANIATQSLISLANKQSRMTCMSLCSSNSACLTFVFDNKYGLIYNCFIYNRYFLPSELINSSSSSISEIKTSIFNLSYLKPYHIFKKIVSLNAC